KLPVRDEGSDADDRVVGVLRKLIADGLADFHVRLADKIVGRREPAEVGHSLQVPDDDARFHWTEYNMRPRVLGPALRGGLMRLGLLQVACLTHSGLVGRPRRRSRVRTH